MVLNGINPNLVTSGVTSGVTIMGESAPKETTGLKDTTKKDTTTSEKSSITTPNANESGFMSNLWGYVTMPFSYAKSFFSWILSFCWSDKNAVFEAILKDLAQLEAAIGPQGSDESFDTVFAKLPANIQQKFANKLFRNEVADMSPLEIQGLKRETLFHDKDGKPKAAHELYKDEDLIKEVRGYVARQAAPYALKSATE